MSAHALSSQQFGDLAGELHTKGGFSINVHTGKRPTSGVMVSDMIGERQLPARQATGPAIQSYTEESKGKRLRGPNRFLGGWKEGDTAYLDRSTRYPDTPHGQARGYVRMVANLQKAAYDVGHDSYIDNPARQGSADRGPMGSLRRMSGQNVP